MWKGITLLEGLVALLIISMLTLLSLPAWQQANARLILNKEQQKLYLFLRQIQSRVENSNEIWLLLASRNLEEKRWCLTAQIKSEQLCDCLYPTACQNVFAHFYYPYYQDQTMLSTKSYYPKEMTRLNGIRNTFSTACFVLQADSIRTVFSFFNVGSLKLKGYQSSSACISGV